MKRFPLGRIAALMMIIFISTQAIGAAVPFQQLNVILTNVNLTNQSRDPQEPIFRPHLLNKTDTYSTYPTNTDANSTLINSTEACTSFRCIADKYYFGSQYRGAILTALLIGMGCILYCVYSLKMRTEDDATGQENNHLRRNSQPSISISSQEGAPQLSQNSGHQNPLEPIQMHHLNLAEIKGASSIPPTRYHEQLTVHAIPSFPSAEDLKLETFVNIPPPKPPIEVTPPRLEP